MPSSPSEWDAKHNLAAAEVAEAPAGILFELLPLLDEMEARQGSGVKPLLHSRAALDLACGTGRNALFLAERGRHVTAVDWSEAALDILEARARSKNLPTRRIHALQEVKRSARAGIDLVQADLERIELPAGRFDLILNIRYLQRSLFPQICRALRPNGMLLLETYTQAQLDFCGGLRNPAFLLKAGELREAFPELDVIFYRALRAEQGIASLAARKLRGSDHHRNGE